MSEQLKPLNERRPEGWYWVQLLHHDGRSDCGTLWMCMEFDHDRGWYDEEISEYISEEWLFKINEQRIQDPDKGQATYMFPIDGNDRGFVGDVILIHFRGSLKVSHSNWVGSDPVLRYGSHREEPAYVGMIDSGYTHWIPVPEVQE